MYVHIQTEPTNSDIYCAFKVVFLHCIISIQIINKHSIAKLIVVIIIVRIIVVITIFLIIYTHTDRSQVNISPYYNKTRRLSVNKSNEK